MLNIPERQKVSLLVAWGTYVRSGGVSKRTHKVRAPSVSLAFQAISTTLQLASKPNPLVDAQGNYPKAIKMLLQGYANEDPPAQPKLAVPVSVPNMMYDIGCSKTERSKCIGDFGLIAFYYLLRVGEYTYSKPSERRRTQQFRLRDVTLWCNTERLDPELPLDVLYNRCTAATLNISNQKNGVRAQTIHQEAIFTRYCPIRAIIRRIKHI